MFAGLTPFFSWVVMFFAFFSCSPFFPSHFVFFSFFVACNRQESVFVCKWVKPTHQGPVLHSTDLLRVWSLGLGPQRGLPDEHPIRQEAVGPVARVWVQGTLVKTRGRLDQPWLMEPKRPQNAATAV